MIRAALLLLLAACGGGDDPEGTTDTDPTATTPTGACAGLCVGAGFDDGTETDFGGGLIECVCEGTGGAIAQDDCATYCADFGVDAANSYLSENASPDDKCVCDGTT